MKLGRVCEIHSEYCPTGDCRWCEPAPAAPPVATIGGIQVGAPVRHKPNGQPAGIVEKRRKAFEDRATEVREEGGYLFAGIDLASGPDITALVLQQGNSFAAWSQEQLPSAASIIENIEKIWRAMEAQRERAVDAEQTARFFGRDHYGKSIVQRLAPLLLPPIARGNTVVIDSLRIASEYKPGDELSDGRRTFEILRIEGTRVTAREVNHLRGFEIAGVVVDDL